MTRTGRRGCTSRPTLERSSTTSPSRAAVAARPPGRSHAPRWRTGWCAPRSAGRSAGCWTSGRALEVCDELGVPDRRPLVEELIGAAAGTREARAGAGCLLAARAVPSPSSRTGTAEPDHDHLATGSVLTHMSNGAGGPSTRATGQRASPVLRLCSSTGQRPRLKHEIATVGQRPPSRAALPDLAAEGLTRDGRAVRRAACVIREVHGRLSGLRAAHDRFGENRSVRGHALGVPTSSSGPLAAAVFAFRDFERLA